MLSAKSIISVAALAALAGSTSPSSGQWIPNYQNYTIQRTGLFGPQHTGSAGLQYSEARLFNAPGFVAGYSYRYTGVNTYNGRNAWVWNGLNTTQIGLTGSANTGSTGFQDSQLQFQNAAGQVVGYSFRYTGVNTNNGQDAWVWNGLSTNQIGLTGSANTGSAGFRFSQSQFQNAAGQVVGYSRRFTGVNTDNGQDAWAWNGLTTNQIGLTGSDYTGSAGFQFSQPQLQNAAGQVVGHSRRITGVSTNNGQDVWVSNGLTTNQIGLTGGIYTGRAGYQSSSPYFQNAAGQVVGTSNRITGVSIFTGWNAWVWNGTTTTQIGLTGAANTSTAGYQEVRPRFQNAAGQVVGSSSRFTDTNANNGLDAWVWNGTTTTQIGLTGGANTGSAGFQFSISQFQNAAGQVVGYSRRIFGVNTSIGQNAWVWNGLATTQIGLTGSANTSNSGFQYSDTLFQNATGQVAGFSWRSSSENTYNGQDAWVWNGLATTQVGLTGSGYTGSAGYQHSQPNLQNAVGQVAGISHRYIGSNSYNGQDAWVWNGLATTQIGLTGSGYTGSAGFQFSDTHRQNDAGQVVGISYRINGASTNNGQNAWVWNGLTTTQIGLTESANTGSAGYQYSLSRFQNAAGQVAGYSVRYSGVNTNNGQDAWYYNPVTNLTSAIIGSVRTSDNYAFSSATLLTEGGFLLGTYLFFAGGLGSGEERAFIFRPDLGLTDLGNLVSGGLTANGWSTLQNPQFSDALTTIVGYGYVNGQTTGLSVFVMNVPTPGAAALLALSSLAATRRRR